MNTAIGCHVFAGGFTWGVRKVHHVPCQLEMHGLGKRTVEAQGHEFIMAGDWHGWPKKEGHFLFGNPRCTGFSCVTAGYGEDSHGAWSKPTKDIHDLCHYGIENEFPVICWESVQQAYTVGKPLLDYLRDTLFVPKGYRIAHLFINGASFGNAQHRKRYFFLAYRDDKNFNIIPPQIPERHTTVGDVILTEEFKGYTPVEHKFSRHSPDPLPDCYAKRTDIEKEIMQGLPKGYDLNLLGHKHEEYLEHCSSWLAEKWFQRTSDMPFSMHCLCRLHEDYFMPVIAGTCSRYVHPNEDRALTVRELSRLMGWPADVLPVGHEPFAELGKGIVPDVGEWLARQVDLYLDDHWGKTDWESKYDHNRGVWVGADYTGHPFGPPEKVFDLTRYSPPKPEKEPWPTTEELIGMKGR